MSNDFFMCVCDGICEMNTEIYLFEKKKQSGGLRICWHLKRPITAIESQSHPESGPIRICRPHKYR